MEICTMSQFSSYFTKERVCIFGIIATLTFYAFLLRFSGLGVMDLWTDEALTLFFSSIQNPIEILNLPTSIGEFNPPLFYLMEHYMLTFGNSEVVLRFLPAVFGVLAIPATYLVGREIYSSDAGIFAATCMAVSTAHILYSQEARAYTLVVLVCLGVLYYATKALKSEDRKQSVRYFTYMGILSGLALWTHFYTAIFLLVLYVVILYLFREKKILLSMVWAGLVASPILLAMASLFLARTSSPVHFGFTGFFETIGYGLLMFLGLHTLTISIMLGFLGFAVYTLFHMNWYTNDPAVQKLRQVPLYLLIGTLALSGILSYFMPMLPRYFLFALPLVMLLIGSFAIPTIALGYPRKLIFVLFVAVVIICSVPSYIEYTHTVKEDWSGIASDLITYTHPGDAVIGVPEYLNTTILYYYTPGDHGTAFHSTRSLGEIRNITREYQGNGKEAFVVVSHLINVEDPSGETYQWIHTHGEMLSSRETNLYLYRMQPLS
jgi:4-amino-4-deoxy-L-arabinose transferase-like glycosyltransferase